MTQQWSYTLPQGGPLYPAPPYSYRNVKRISALCRGNRNGLRDALPEPLELVGDLFEVTIKTAPDVSGIGGYDSAAISIPCRYKGTDAGHVAYEYVTSDTSMAAGREIWGYPKKIAAVDFNVSEKGIVGILRRNGGIIAKIDFTYADRPAPARPTMVPRLQIKRMPRMDNQGLDMNQVIEVDLPNMVVHERRQGTATVELNSIKDDPLSQLGPVEVLGAEYVCASYTLAFGKLIDSLPTKRG